MPCVYSLMLLLKQKGFQMHRKSHCPSHHTAMKMSFCAAAGHTGMDRHRTALAHHGAGIVAIAHAADGAWHGSASHHAKH